MDLEERLAHQFGVGSQGLAMAKNKDSRGDTSAELHYEKRISCGSTTK